MIFEQPSLKRCRTSSLLIHAVGNHSDLFPRPHLVVSYPCTSPYVNLAISNHDTEFAANTVSSFYSPFPSMSFGSKPGTSVTEIHAAKQSLSSKFIVSI